MVSASSDDVWRLLGYDTFSREWYALDTYASEAEALAAAAARLKDLEELQPTEMSGGQEGIQDQVHIFRPDGASYRVRKSPSAK